ncbi:hypothetical protein CC2G_015277 [Coprinopsis cinerea AmutBmut pab1-1]|nr:hypothetical protein CC2G_015277 [Coprinopsis cinerea AmutBmut pab1-1]
MNLFTGSPMFPRACPKVAVPPLNGTARATPGQPYRVLPIPLLREDGEEDSQALAAEGLPHHTTSAACIARLVPGPISPPSSPNAP